MFSVLTVWSRCNIASLGFILREGNLIVHRTEKLKDSQFTHVKLNAHTEQLSLYLGREISSCSSARS